MSKNENRADASGISAGEWTTRVELAAVYRLINHYGWDEFIYNHAAARVPGEPGKFLIKKHELIYTDVTASNLVKVDMHSPLDAKLGVNGPGFVLHSGVMLTRPDVNYSIHIHTPQAGAVSALPSGLRMISQAALRCYGRMAYHDFQGIAEGAAEREQIGREIADKNILILRNHGVLTIGQYCGPTFGTLRHFMTACEIQLLAEATGQPLKDIDPEICASTARQIDAAEGKRGNADMASYLRFADTLVPGYRD